MDILYLFFNFSCSILHCERQCDRDGGNEERIKVSKKTEKGNKGKRQWTKHRRRKTKGARSTKAIYRER